MRLAAKIENFFWAPGSGFKQEKVFILSVSSVEVSVH